MKYDKICLQSVAWAKKNDYIFFNQNPGNFW